VRDLGYFIYVAEEVIGVQGVREVVSIRVDVVKKREKKRNNKKRDL